VHDRVIFAGDSAHQVSPFGARGANSGVQDAENLAWKLAAVIDRRAPAGLLASYDSERGQAAGENIAHSTRSTDFIAPRTRTERLFRDATLALAAKTDFAKRLVNSGRLSTATRYDTPLSTPDEEPFAGVAALGAPLPDAPLAGGDYLLDRLGQGFTVLHVPDGAEPPPRIDGAELLVVGRDITPADELLAQRLDASPGATFLVRPDQHLAARMRCFDTSRLEQALARALGHCNG